MSEVFPGLVAIALGVVAGIAFFVPFVMLSYHRRGTLTLGRFALWATALVYSWALWTYTLLPLPDASDIRCAGVNLDPLGFVADIGTALARNGASLRALGDPAVLQLLLNILLFLPLGFLIRVLGGRGIVVALVAGLAVSALIETTQLTGVWGLYPCAYRVFDVDDLLTNTTGAVLGSLLALPVPRRLWGRGRHADAELPRPVTKRRRLLAALCDWLGFTLTAAAMAVLLQAVLISADADPDAILLGEFSARLGGAVASALWLVLVLSTGRTVGDLAVRIRYTGGPLPLLPARLLRYMGGIGGYGLLSLLPTPWGALAFAYAIAGIVLIMSTAKGRGLPGLLSGQRLADARETSSHAAVPGEERENGD